MQKQVLRDLHNCCTTVAALRTGRYAVIGCKLKQNADEGCNSCASVAGLVLCFIACFILLLIAPSVKGRNDELCVKPISQSR